MSLLLLFLSRAESGKTGCFSPKISRKEMVRRSLRLKFGLGKSSRDVVSIPFLLQCKLLFKVLGTAFHQLEGPDCKRWGKSNWTCYQVQEAVGLFA